MNGKLIHIPTGKIYSYYDSGVFEDNMGELMIWLRVRHGRKPSEYIELPWGDTKEIKKNN